LNKENNGDGKGRKGKGDKEKERKGRESKERVTVEFGALQSSMRF